LDESLSLAAKAMTARGGEAACPLRLFFLLHHQPRRQLVETMDRSTVRTVDPLVITVEELAELMQTSVRSIWRWNSQHSIPKPLRIGGSVRWRRDEVLKWIEQGCPAVNQMVFESEGQA
jgi:excisionase family DNA binding protein